MGRFREDVIAVGVFLAVIPRTPEAQLSVYELNLPIKSTEEVGFHLCIQTRYQQDISAALMRPIQTEFKEIFQKVSTITLLVLWPHLVWGRWKQDTYVLKVSQCQEDNTMDKSRTQWETPTRWPRIPLHWIKEGLRNQWNRQWNRLWRQIIPWLPRFRLFQGLSYGFPWSWTQKKGLACTCDGQCLIIIFELPPERDVYQKLQQPPCTQTPLSERLWPYLIPEVPIF